MKQEDYINEANNLLIIKLCPFLGDHCSKECQFFRGASFKSMNGGADSDRLTYLSKAYCKLGK